MTSSASQTVDDVWNLRRPSNIGNIGSDTLKPMAFVRASPFALIVTTLKRFSRYCTDVLISQTINDALKLEFKKLCDDRIGTDERSSTQSFYGAI